MNEIDVDLPKLPNNTQLVLMIVSTKPLTLTNLNNRFIQAGFETSITTLKNRCIAARIAGVKIPQIPVS